MLALRRRVVDPVPKRNIYSIMYILFFDRISGQYVSKYRYFIMAYNGIYDMSKGYLLKIWHQKELYMYLSFSR